MLIYFSNFFSFFNLFKSLLCSLLLHNYDGKSPRIVILVIFICKSPVLENELILRRVRYLDLAPLALLVHFELINTYLLNSLKLNLNKEDIRLVLNTELHLRI